MAALTRIDKGGQSQIGSRNDLSPPRPPREPLNPLELLQFPHRKVGPSEEFKRRQSALRHEPLNELLAPPQDNPALRKVHKPMLFRARLRKALKLGLHGLRLIGFDRAVQEDLSRAGDVHVQQRNK